MSLTFLPLAEAAAQLGLAPSTLRHQLRARRFHATKIGGGWYVKPEEVERYRREVQGITESELRVLDGNR